MKSGSNASAWTKRAVCVCHARPRWPNATPKWVEVVRRGDVTFAINHSREPCTVEIPGREAVVGEWKKGKARLGAYGVCAVRG